VLRGSSKKKQRAAGNAERTPEGEKGSGPQTPPSPDLSGLSTEEMAILRDVLRRQEQLESTEVDREKYELLSHPFKSREQGH